MASALSARSQRLPTRQRVRNFGRGVTYQVAGLPIAVRSVRRGRTPERVIRRAYSRRYWQPRDWSERSQLALALIIWPFVLIGLQIAFTVKNGREVSKKMGRPVHRQLLDQLQLYLKAGVLPPWYYIFELHRFPDAANARDYFYRWESKAGVLGLFREGVLAPTSELNDKAAFARQCRDHQIRTAPVLAILRDGRAEITASNDDFDTDLFLKPVTGRGGKGAQRWDLAAPGRYRTSNGETFSREDLLLRLAAKSLVTPMLVQQRLENHPDLKALNNGALSTVRVLTCLNEKGHPEVIGAAARMAIGANHVVDNLHAGGIAAAVDVQTGVLGRASNLGADTRLGWLDWHPVSGARITGTRLPMWDDVREFALRAHRGFADRILVGWDIAITPDGPVMVEGNGSPDLDIMQRFVGRGLLAGRLGVLLAFHVSKLRLDARTPA